MMKLKDFPDDLSLTIFNKALQVFAEKSLEKLSKLITEYSLQFKDPELEGKSFKTLTAWQYVFDTIDFFLQNEFITQEQHRNFFQEYNMLREVIYYTSNVFQVQSRANLDDNLLALTKHWYWKSEKNPFSDLRSRGQERVIEFVSILERIKQNLENLTTLHDDTKSKDSFQRISNMLSSPDYFNTYKYIHGSNPPVSYGIESVQLGHQVLTDPKGFVAATKTIIHQILLHSEIPSGFVYLMTEDQSDTQDETKEVIQLVFLTSRYHMLKQIAEKYWQIKNNASGNSTQGLAYNKSIYQGYLKELAEVFKDFKDVKFRFPPDDFRTVKFDIHFKYKIELIDQNGEIQLNHLEAKA
ncbi:hypothetical protein PGT21_050173 [Puccinia graminis f. sp. tritici]|uniref:Uncharacterized protein n=1 Tax=Puccinia graminis f. sp. tritici TaxID=56615 RepID=A0A5B0P8H7_PUCGR|nr:hypothetical protein PGT21_050173 [Puccinia graminis f. sp. tritici]